MAAFMACAVGEVVFLVAGAGGESGSSFKMRWTVVLPK